MTIESIQAVQECMKFLGLRLDQPESSKIECTFVKDRVRGLMYVQFLNDVHAHHGPYIGFDETIRGFGIPYLTFKPSFQEFVFEVEDGNGMLTCSDSKFTFTLRF